MPPAPVEGIPANESVVWAAASGHTALVTDVGHLYTAGRNDSAGGGGHGSPPVRDAGQLGRGGDVAAFALVARTSPRATRCVRPSLVRTIPHRRCHRARRRANLRPERSRPTRPRGRRGRVDERRVFVRLGGDCACAKHSASAEAAEPGAPCHGGAACRHGIARGVDLTLAGVDDPRAVMVAAGRYAAAAAPRRAKSPPGDSTRAEGDGGLDASPISPASLLSDPALAATPRLVRHAATNDFRDDKAVAVVFGTRRCSCSSASGALYSCDTDSTGYAAGLGGAEGADAYVPNREKQLGDLSRVANLRSRPTSWAVRWRENASPRWTRGDATGVVAAEDGRVCAFGAARWAARDATANRGW